MGAAEAVKLFNHVRTWQDREAAGLCADEGHDAITSSASALPSLGPPLPSLGPPSLGVVLISQLLPKTISLMFRLVSIMFDHGCDSCD